MYFTVLRFNCMLLLLYASVLLIITSQPAVSQPACTVQLALGLVASIFEFRIQKYEATFWHRQANDFENEKVLCSTPCPPQNTCDYIFYNNFNNKCPITIIFGIVSIQSMRHRKMVSLPISPIYCNLTLGNHRTQKIAKFAVSNIVL